MKTSTIWKINWAGLVLSVVLVIALAILMAGCVGVNAKIVTPYGSVSRNAAGETTVELDTRGFAK